MMPSGPDPSEPKAGTEVARKTDRGPNRKTYHQWENDRVITNGRMTQIGNVLQQLNLCGNRSDLLNMRNIPRMEQVAVL
jgi:hypothetical protein